MDVYTPLEHMRGQALTVNGTRYEVGQDLIIRGMSKEDGEKLISGRMYMDAKEAPPSKAGKAKPTVAKVAEKAPAKAEAKPKAEPIPEDAPEAEVILADDDDDDMEDFPDPHEDLGIEKLREMADAYEVSYTKKTAAKTLVKQLNDAMFE